MSHAIIVAELYKRGENYLAHEYIRTAGFYEIIDSIKDRGKKSLRRIIFPALVVWLANNQVSRSMIRPLAREIIKNIEKNWKSERHENIARMVLSVSLSVILNLLVKRVVHERLCSTLPNDEYCRLVYLNKRYWDLPAARRKLYLLQYYSGKSEQELKNALDKYFKLINKHSG